MRTMWQMTAVLTLIAGFGMAPSLASAQHGNGNAGGMGAGFGGAAGPGGRFGGGLQGMEDSLRPDGAFGHQVNGNADIRADDAAHPGGFGATVSDEAHAKGRNIRNTDNFGARISHDAHAMNDPDRDAADATVRSHPLKHHATGMPLQANASLRGRLESRHGVTATVRTNKGTAHALAGQAKLHGHFGHSMHVLAKASLHHARKVHKT